MRLQRSARIRRLALLRFRRGVPFYWEALDFSDVRSAIRQAALEPGTLLFDEGAFLVREELREPREYFSLLRPLARGPRPLGDLCGELRIGKHIASKYLSVLPGLYRVERRVPITQQIGKSPGLYAAADPFLSFWFRVVFPYKTSLGLGAVEPVLDRIDAGLTDHLAAVDEAMALDALLESAVAEGRTLLGTGRWWISRKGRQHEIDGILRTEGETWCLEAEIGGKPDPSRLAAAARALQENAASRSMDLGRIRLFGFEASRRFAGQEMRWPE